MALGVGAKVKGWRLDALLGEGPLSATYEATFAGETGSQERAVVRVMTGPLVADERARGQFLRAAYAANRFRHPRVVAVSQDGVADDQAPCVVRPWQDAKPLAEVVMRDDGAPPPTAREVLRIAEQVLDALEIAHAHGIVHGAISPTNVLVTERRSIRLVDFSVPQREERDLLAPARVGPYTAPERCSTSAPAPATDATDVWCLAACMYFALTKEAPRGTASTADELATRPARPLVELAPEVDPNVAAIVDHALQLDPTKRYDGAYAMLGDVRRAMAGRKPKLGAALRPVPSGSYRELVAPAASVRAQALTTTDLGAAPTTTARRRAAHREWRGNVALILAIAALVGVATFVMVREKRAEVTAPPAPASTQMYH